MDQSNVNKLVDKVNLTYVGKVGFGEEVPIYTDQNDLYWGDLNAKEEGHPEFHKYEIFMNDYDNWQEVLSNKPRIEEIYPDSEINIVSDFEQNKVFRENYMLLSRLKQDCEYYLGWGGRSKNCLWAGNEIEQIDEMKKLYNSFPDDKKPQWITMEDIEKYEIQMCNNEKEEIEKENHEEEYLMEI